MAYQTQLLHEKEQQLECLPCWLTLTFLESWRKRSLPAATDNFQANYLHSYSFLHQLHKNSFLTLCEHKDPGGWLESIFNRCLWMSAMTVWRVCTATACTLTSTRGSVQFQMKLWIRICSASLLTGISIVMKKQWKHPGTWLSAT